MVSPAAWVRILVYTPVVFVFGIVNAQASLIDELRDHVLGQDSVTGHFVQCITQGNVKITRIGQYVLTPRVQLEMKFEQPQKYSMVFYSDGTYKKFDSSVEMKSQRYSAISNLIFSIVSMEKAKLENYFEIVTTGSFDSFEVSLIPNDRMKNAVQTVSLSGADGAVKWFSLIVSGGRKIEMNMYRAVEPMLTECV